jgi:hypothetical protein
MVYRILAKSHFSQHFAGQTWSKVFQIRGQFDLSDYLINSHFFFCKSDTDSSLLATIIIYS